MKKFYVSIERNSAILIQELEVELTDKKFPGMKSHECMYRILSPGPFQGEVWCWWAFSDTEKEACEKIGLIHLDKLRGNFFKFLKFMDMIVHDTLGERTKWRV